ncbi:alpha/beta hydrolase [Tsuneonella sp. SYSU-LHT278]|uniref:alpha/beta hydrolase n=1 Tax=Tsuneonella sediminis TaxID=3416089 RepID=UPI003F7A3067
MIGRLLALVLAVIALSACVTAPRQDTIGPGRFVEWERIAAAGLPDQRVSIWLPPGYDKDRRRYPVLYMHDGHNLFDPARASFGKVWAADKAMLRLVGEGKVEPHIIVGIWAPGDDRYRQYLPQFVADEATGKLAESIARNAQGRPIVSAQYLAWIADELKPRIDRVLRTRGGPEDTAIAGSSMGGLMSCYAVVERPDVFGRAACVSSHWPIALPQVAEENRAQVMAIWQDWLDRKLGRPDGRRIWMDHGDGTLDAFYAPYQSAVDASFRKARWREGEDWKTLVYPCAEHEESAWAARLPEVLEWLLRGT